MMRTSRKERPFYDKRQEELKISKIINTRKINDNDSVNYVKINDEIRITHNSFHNKVAHMKKINNYFGVNTETGELIEFKRSQNRGQRICDFKRSLSNLRDIIKLNVTDLEKCFFITLTYEDNISDRNVLRKDFDNFIRKFRRKFGKCKYINAVEYQGRGALHCHLIVIFYDIPTVLITNEDINKCWKHGSADIGPVTSAEADAKYLTNFLFEYDEKNEDLDYQFKSKKQRKGERISFYDSNSRLYNCSQDIKRPEVVKNITYGEVKEKFGLTKCEKSLSIWNDDNNIVTIENYKTKKEEFDEIN